MLGYLPNFELRFYLCFYIILLVILIYNVQITSNSNLPDYHYMSKGWSWLDRKIDDYDEEWQSFKSNIAKYWYCFATHSFAAEIFRFMRFGNISILYFTIGATSCFIMYNLHFFLMLLLQTAVCYIVSTISRSKFSIWLLTSFWLAIINYLKYEHNFKFLIEILNIEEADVHEFIVIFSWCMLKNISFNLERIEGHDRNVTKFDFINCLGYVFYFPSFLNGPHVIYKRYSEMLDKNGDFTPLSERYQNLVMNLSRMAFWFFLAEFALHFLYMNSIVLNLDLKLLNTATFFGVGYLLGQFFNIKYIVQYGVSIAFGRFDGIQMPNPPRCICQIHKYSDMWKWFDHGLYEFLFKYIYTCICTKRSSLLRRIFAGFVTFLFIYLWHGFFDYILIWSVLNCVCIVLEKFVYHVIESESFRVKAIHVVITDNNVHRLHAFIGVHVLIPAIISNLFFFGGVEVGWEFVRRTYLCGFFNYLKISLCIYCLYPVAETIKRWNENNKT